MNFISYKNLSDKYNREIDNAIQDEIRPYCLKHKITYLQYQILEAMYEDGETTNIGQMSDKMSMDQGNMSAQCKRLEQKGYTLRLRRKVDERIVEVSLTRMGRLVVQEINEALNRRYKDRWLQLTDAEQNTLIEAYAIMRKLYKKDVVEEEVDETNKNEKNRE